MSVPPLSLAAIRQPAFLYDADGRIAEANDRAEALAGRFLAGRTLAAVVGIFDARSPDGTPLLAADMPSARALRGEEAVDVPLVVTAADGPTLHVLATAAPIRNGGEVVGALSIWQDISVRERVRAEAEAAAEELQVQQDELRQSLAAIAEREAELRSTALFPMQNPLPVLRVDDRGHLLWTNPAGRAVFEDWHLENGGLLPDVLGSEIRQASSERRAGQVELRHGSTTFTVAVVPIPDQHYVNLYFSDITERKRAEAELRESEARFRSVLDSSLDALYRLNLATGRYEYVSPAFERVVGRSAEEMRSRAPEETMAWVHPDDLPVAVAGLARLDETGTAEIDYRLLGADGRYRWLSNHLRLVRDDAGRPLYRDGSVRDITGEHRITEALRESEARYRELFESMVEGFALHEIALDAAGNPADYRFLAANPAFEAMTGLSAGEIVGRTALEVLPGLEPGWIERYGRVAATGEPERFLSYSSPLERWYDVHAYSPGPGLFATVFTDVTSERRALGALRESEERFRLLFENSQEALFVYEPVIDEDGRVIDVRYVDVNPAAERFVGKTRAELIGRSSAEALGGSPTTSSIDTLARVAHTGEPTHYIEYSFRLGRWYEAFMYAHQPGQVAMLLLDITERKEAEEALRETRDYLDNLINYANAPIIVWNPDLRITRFNAAFERMSGYAADEVIGRELFVLFPEESRDESLQKIQRTITGQWQSVEIPILRPDGGVRIALWNSANIYDQTGATLLATIAQGQDITERKEAEAALREYAENLQQSNEDLERYAYVSSHDLQEPLRAIVSFSQLLERRYRGQLDADADDYINFIVEGGTRMQTLIQDLLAYSRVNTTKQDLRPTDMEDVMAAVERNLDLQLREAGAVLTHDPVPVVPADPLQLEQVVANLVSNAIKFRRDDEPLRIHVGARRTDGFWEFSVSDNGIGIEPEYFDQIFVIFQRLHTKDAYPGTGIGLAIVKRIIDRHGGTIRVESTPGEGSTFFFTLPAA